MTTSMNRDIPDVEEVSADMERVGLVAKRRAIRSRVNRAEGQLRGVSRMLDEGKECEDVLVQLMAVRTAIDRAMSELVVSHIDDCITRLPPDEARGTVSRAVKLLGRLG